MYKCVRSSAYCTYIAHCNVYCILKALVLTKTCGCVETFLLLHSTQAISQNLKQLPEAVTLTNPQTQSARHTARSPVWSRMGSKVL